LDGSLDADSVTPKEEFESSSRTTHAGRPLGAVSLIVEDEINHPSPEEHPVCFDLSPADPSEYWSREAYIENFAHGATTPMPIPNLMRHGIDPMLTFASIGLTASEQSAEPCPIPDVYLRPTPVATLAKNTNHALNIPADFNHAAFTGTRARRYGSGNSSGGGMADSDMLSFQKLISLYTREDITTCYSSYEEAMRERHKNGSQVDTTIPTDNKQKRAIVKALCQAMQSTTYAEDNQNMITPFKNSKIPVERMEFACWRILVSCVIC
jgi:hypothetical protein